MKTIPSRLCFKTTPPDPAPALCCRPPLLHRHISPSLSGHQLPPLLVIYSTVKFKQLSPSNANVLLDWDLNNTLSSNFKIRHLNNTLNTEDHHHRHPNFLQRPDMQEMPSLITCRCLGFQRE